MKRILVVLLLVPTLAFATTETIRPNTDGSTEGADGDEASATGYTTEPCGGSGTACDATDCYTYIDDDPDTGGSDAIGGDACSGSSTNAAFSLWYEMGTPTVGTDWHATNTQQIAVRARTSQDSCGGIPTLEPEAWCDGSPVGLTGTGCTAQNLSNTEAVLTCNFTKSDLTNPNPGQACGPDKIEIGFICTGYTSGGPGGRCNCSIDGVELRGDFVTTTTTLGGGRRAMVISSIWDYFFDAWDWLMGTNKAYAGSNSDS